MFSATSPADTRATTAPSSPPAPDGHAAGPRRRGRALRALIPSRAESGAAALSAALFALAFPPFPLVLPAFLCLVPLGVFVARLADREGDRAVGSAARAGFWFGLLGYGCNLYWIAVALSLFTKLAIAGYVAALLWLAPFVALTTAALFLARRHTRWPLVVLLPVAWVASELVLNYLADLAFPWLPLGLSVTSHPVLAQIADLSGVRGVSFWIAATNGLLADAWLLLRPTPSLDLDRATTRPAGGRAALRVVAAGALAVAVAAYGQWRMRTTRLETVAPIAVVQPNIPEDEKLQRDNPDIFVGKLAALTRQNYATSNPALMLWPETALPDFIDQHPNWPDSIAALARVERVPLIFGTLDIQWKRPFAPPSAGTGDGEPQYDYYNAALLADAGGRIGVAPPYRKGYLVPIVERVPFLDPAWFGGLKYFGGFGRGIDPEPFVLPFGKAGVLICYESIFPQLSRRYRQHGAKLLLNITNDAWFGRSAAPYQHHAHMVLRAIENRVGVVRAANTGISGYIDPLGVVHDETALFVPATRTYLAQTTSVRTPYVAVGDWVGALSLLTIVVLVALDARHRRRRTARDRTAAPLA
ncbi:MAG TPA: apolipoprotein N-acyltransferase [Gemmatimonadaceae bacterium]|nr:apolipoprotein N-acyltransferase [Gemmatimonadaceae bacterium]